MVQFSPVSGRTTSPGGYRYDDRTIRGFALTRLSGAGCANLGDLPVMPLTRPFAKVGADPGGTPLATFRHGAESATPGRYRVAFSNGVRTSLTATLRTGDATFVFPGTNAYLSLDPGGGATDQAAISIAAAGPTEVRGSVTDQGFCGGPATTTLYFVARFDRPMRSVSSWGEDGIVDAGTPSRTTVNTGGLLLGFATHTVRMKVGVSHVSTANAALNLTRESPGWDFGRLASRARAAWSRVLDRVRVDGGSPAARRTFYTALYHALIHPTLASDVNGEFRRRDGGVGKASYRRMTNISGWDVYRTQVPLLALVEPDIATDLVRSMVDGAAESGSLPKWEYAGVESGIMVGDPAAPLIANASAFGARGASAALPALVRAAEQADAGPFVYPSNRAPTDGSRFGPFVERPGLADYLSLGFVPYDQRSGTIWGTASTTLEYAIADFAISRLAASAGDAADAATFLGRSASWRRLYNPATGYIEPRNADGSFLPGFSHVSDAGFVEGNATQYTWLVPYDVAGLVGAIGRDRARARLAALLSRLDTSQSAPYAWLGNEPTFDTPWLPLWVGEPATTQATVRRAVTTLFQPWPAGLPGDDDLGALSAWYVWGALGLYPAIPGVPGLAIASPSFASVKIAAGGRTIVLRSSGRGPFVRSLSVNGTPASRTWLTLPSHGTVDLRFALAATPQPWGSAPADAPPSFAPPG